MEKNRIMIIGERETFLIRVLVKKLNEAGIDAIYTAPDINSINAKWEGTTLLTYYLDNDERVKDDVIRYLTDRMTDEAMQIVIIGDSVNNRYISDHMPGELIYRVFTRPLDAEEYVGTVRELFSRIEAGEYKKSILVVDDDPTYLGLVRDWLKSEYKVSMVTSGLQAIKWLGKNKADLILLDYEMPVTTGPQVLEMLRSDAETQDIPVIFLTGRSDKKSVMAVVELKPEGYFLKNIEKEELLSKLKEFFDKNK